MFPMRDVRNQKLKAHIHTSITHPWPKGGTLLCYWAPIAKTLFELLELTNLHVNAKVYDFKSTPMERKDLVRIIPCKQIEYKLWRLENMW